MIESVNNERVKMWTKLNDKKYQNETGLFIVEGEHLVEEAYKAGVLKEVISLDNDKYTYENQISVSEAVMKKITSLNTPPQIIGIAYQIKPREIRGNVLILDCISDPGNLGTIIRSSVAFNVDTIIMSKGCVSLYNPKVVRATEGLLFHINIIENANLPEMIETLKREDYTIYGTKVDGGTSIKDIKFKENSAIIMGNEGKGVSEEVNSLSDEYLYIDMNKTCESLNVGVATSIILYELNKK